VDTHLKIILPDSNPDGITPLKELFCMNLPQIQRWEWL